MKSHLVEDQTRNDRSVEANRGIIGACFGGVNEGVVDGHIEDLEVAKCNSETKGNEEPIKGSTQQGKA